MIAIQTQRSFERGGRREAATGGAQERRARRIRGARLTELVRELLVLREDEVEAHVDRPSAGPNVALRDLAW